MPLPSALSRALLATALFPAFLLARPTLRLDAERAVPKKSVGETLFGESEGKWWFFKKDKPTQTQWYGNLEAEILVGRILTAFGYLVPQSRLVHLEGRDGVFVQMEILGEGFGGMQEIHLLQHWKDLPHRPEIDPDRVRLLQMLDVILGNGDRHRGNLMVGVDAAGSPHLIPIDHNLALSSASVANNFFNLHFTKSFDGLQKESRNPEYQRHSHPTYAKDSGTIGHITARNWLYAELSRASEGQGKDLSTGYIPMVNYAKRRLSDAFLNQLLSQIPDEDFLGPDPQTRRREILDILTWRRDNLSPQLIRYAQARSQDLAAKSLRWATSLTQLLSRGLPGPRLGTEDIHYLGVHATGPEGLKPGPLYLALRELGFPEASARQITLELSASEKVPFRSQDLGFFEAQHERQEVSRARRTHFGERSTFRAFGDDPQNWNPDLPGAARFPELPEGPRFLRILWRQGQDGSSRIEDGLGRKLRPSSVPGLRDYLTFLADHEPGDYEFFRDVFGSSPEVWRFPVTRTQGALRLKVGVFEQPRFTP